MSFPQNGEVTVNITIPAGWALDVVKQILWALSRAKDIQDKGISLDEDEEDGRFVRHLMRIRVREGVILEIIPDEISPNSSRYGNYSTPNEKLYLPKPNE